ncbi:MAG: methylmalonyl-CoA epimerase [Gemmatimonadota bacterium]|nr:methylmalonyl-CoA epimerase [Gemmatimonadota bacterium]
MQNLPATLPLDHVAVAVPSIEEHRTYYESLSRETCSTPTTIEGQGVRVAFVGMMELLEPTGPDTTVGRFLAKRGPGLHHVAYRTTDIEREMERARDQGMRLIDESPRPGAHGLVAFLHPSSTGGVLVELVQRDS